MEPIQLTGDGFKERIFNYETAETWKYQGTLPAIVDFYADWCGPCKALSPILEDLAVTYSDKILVYKVDTDKEMELSQLFGIQSIPTLLFIPMEGAPMIQKGALPKNVLEQIIEERLLVASKEETAGKE